MKYGKYKLEFRRRETDRWETLRNPAGEELRFLSIHQALDYVYDDLRADPRFDFQFQVVDSSTVARLTTQEDVRQILELGERDRTPAHTLPATLGFGRFR
jgi:hypothetical protein